MANIDRVEFKPYTKVVFAGPPYSGKTTLGLEVSSRTNLKFVDINTVRWLFQENGEEFPSSFVRSMAMAETYALAHFRAAQYLEGGEPVSLAATYSHPSYVNNFREFADLHRRKNELPDAATIIFVLHAPEESLPERGEARRRMNDEKYFPYISLETALDLRRRFVPIEGADVVPINTGLSLDENVAQVFAALEPFKKVA